MSYVGSDKDVDKSFYIVGAVGEIRRLVESHPKGIDIDEVRYQAGREGYGTYDILALIDILIKRGEIRREEDGDDLYPVAVHAEEGSPEVSNDAVYVEKAEALAKGGDFSLKSTANLSGFAAEIRIGGEPHAVARGDSMQQAVARVYQAFQIANGRNP